MTRKEKLKRADATLKRMLLRLELSSVPAPVLNRDADGQWTLNYGGPTQDYWQIWWRYNGHETWENNGETRTSDFPQDDASIVPPDAAWWQVKICGEDNEGNPTTPFSNVISHGAVPS